MEVHVFERNAEVREIGAGLSFWSNGLRAVRELGVDAVLGAGSPIEWLENADWKGRSLQRIHVGALGRHVAIQRPDLLGALRRAVGDSVVHVGHCLSSLHQDASGVMARFENGVEAPGDVLVGADGLFSVTRRALHGDTQPPLYAGNVAWRGIASFEHARLPVGVALSLMGRGKHFAVEPIGSGRLFWYAAKNLQDAADGPASLQEPGRKKEELFVHFSDCANPIPALIDATPEDAIFRHRVYDLPAVRPWSRGRVTLLGDAAHAMRPNLGQGACQAVEDAVVLGACLGRVSGIGAALRRYEALRRRRTRWVVYWSKQISRMEYLERPMATWARDRWLHLTPGVLSLPWFSTILAFDAPASSTP